MPFAGAAGTLDLDQRSGFRGADHSDASYEAIQDSPESGLQAAQDYLLLGGLLFAPDPTFQPSAIGISACFLLVGGHMPFQQRKPISHRPFRSHEPGRAELHPPRLAP